MLVGWFIFRALYGRTGVFQGFRKYVGWGIDALLPSYDDEETKELKRKRPKLPIKIPPMFLPTSVQKTSCSPVRLLFDSLMMRGVVEYNPAARARPPRLVRESSHTSIFEEAEIAAFLDSISPNSLKNIRDKAIFCVLIYSWCRVSALINLSVAADYFERGDTRWLRFQEKEEKNTRYRCIQRLKKRSIFGMNVLTWRQTRVLHFSLPSARIVKH
jgi:integrase